jgi:hypothetical protein
MKYKCLGTLIHNGNRFEANEIYDTKQVKGIPETLIDTQFKIISETEAEKEKEIIEKQKNQKNGKGKIEDETIDEEGDEE